MAAFISVYPVSIIRMMSGFFCRTVAKNSVPSISGIRWSEITSATGCDSMRVNPSLGLTVAIISYGSLRKTRRSAWRMFSSSSTQRRRCFDSPPDVSACCSSMSMSMPSLYPDRPVRFFHLFRDRQEDAEGGSFVERALHLDLPPVLLDNAVGDRQSQPRPLPHRLRREERIEDLLDVLRRNPASGVLDLHHNPLPLHSAANPDLPPLSYRLRRIHQNIHEHLIDLLGVADDLGDLSERFDHLRLVLQLVPDDVQRALDPLIHAKAHPLRLIHVREFLEVLNNAAHPLHPI